MISRVGDIHER